MRNSHSVDISCTIDFQVVKSLLLCSLKHNSSVLARQGEFLWSQQSMLLFITGITSLSQIWFDF